MMRLVLCVLLAAIGLIAKSTAQEREPFAAQFVAVPPAQAGIDFVHSTGGKGEMYITETVLGGLATFDYDGDGLIDIYFVNGASIKPGTASRTTTNRLYRNLGNWQFADVTRQAGVGDTSCGMGAVVGDYDNDGDPDLLVTNFGEHVLYQNNGDATFSAVTQASGLASGDRFGAGSAFLDIDSDGNLDLYTASYVEFSVDQHRTRTIAGRKFPPGPNDYPPAKDLLFQSRGDGTFIDISRASGISNFAAPGMGVVAADFDGDGDIDVWVANDQESNFLFLNDSTGQFDEFGVLAGVAVDLSGKANGNMGADVADINSDGLPDLLTTTFQEEMPVIYSNLGMGMFDDATNLSRLDRSLYNHVNWGCGLIDFDHDGDRDAFIACGHFLENLRYIDDRTTVNTQNYLLANDGYGRFSNVSSLAGGGLQVLASSRGAAFEDFDRDGDIDIVILNAEDAPSMLRNDLVSQNQSVHIRLVGIHCNRDAVGAVATLVSELGTQTGIQLAGRGYESAYGRQLHFACPNANAKITIAWPGGGVAESFSVDCYPGCQQVIVQGTGEQ